MRDMCNFIPPKSHRNELEFYHFVYETNIKKLHQPFTHHVHHVHIVFKGTAVLNLEGKKFPIKGGDVFFSFPQQSYTIDADDDFTYLYVSFDGKDTISLLNSFNITKENFIYYNLNSVLSFWLDAVKRINKINANVLTESVLMYTLSFINNPTPDDEKPLKDDFDSVLKYVNNNYTSKDISLKKIADIFFYSEKYLSSLFQKKTGTKFSNYLTKLRIDYALNLIDKGMRNVSDIAGKCGYNDQLYFSKVFKKATNSSPREYIKNISS